MRTLALLAPAAHGPQGSGPAADVPLTLSIQLALSRHGVGGERAPSYSMLEWGSVRPLGFPRSEREISVVGVMQAQPVRPWVGCSVDGRVGRGRDWDGLSRRRDEAGRSLPGLALSKAPL